VVVLNRTIEVSGHGEALQVRSDDDSVSFVEIRDPFRVGFKVDTKSRSMRFSIECTVD